nr:MAG TPA: hypothetical protein [Caudoviricetes sp.]
MKRKRSSCDFWKQIAREFVLKTPRLGKFTSYRIIPKQFNLGGLVIRTQNALVFG